MTKLNTVLEEFERRQTSNRDLLSILNKDNITVEDRRFIRATNAVDTVLAHRRKTQVRAEAAGDTNIVSKGKFDTSKDSVMDLGGGFFYDTETDTVRDAAGNDVTEAYIKAKTTKDEEKT